MAYAGLADTYALLGSYHIMPISESHPLGREAALKALDLDESLGEAHKSLGAILADHYWDWAEAERHFKRAIELAPNNVSALHFYSFYLAYTGNASQALPLAERAIRHDPLSLHAQVNLGVILNMARRYDEAVEQFVRTLDLDSGYAMAHSRHPSPAFMSEGWWPRFSRDGTGWPIGSGRPSGFRPPRRHPAVCNRPTSGIIVNITT
jgi:tetratricopeptide (TPR) repeat protein